MKGTNRVPIEYLRGGIYTDSDFYARVLNGQQIWQLKPRHFSSPQLANQDRFGREQGTANRGIPPSSRKKKPP